MKMMMMMIGRRTTKRWWWGDGKGEEMLTPTYQ
jgi:hypothetical protein